MAALTFDDLEYENKSRALNFDDLPSGGEDRGAFTSAVQGFNSTIPFGNRITAGAASLALAPFTEATIGDLYDTARANQMATEQANPKSNLAGNLLGVAATLPIGLSKAVATTPVIGNVANVLSKTASSVGNFVRGSEAAANAGKLARAGNTALRSAKAGAVAAPVGALYNYGASESDLTSPEAMEDAASGARVAGAMGAAVPLAGAAAGATLGAVLPKVSDGLADIAALARKYKIDVSFDQVSNSRALKNVQKITQELPLSGQSAFREKQLIQWQRQLFKTVGVDAAKFNPQTMNMAFKKVGGEFDNLTKGKQFNIGGDFIDNLTSTADDVASTYGNEAASIFQKEALRVIDDFGRADNISGELISRQRARVNRLARNASDPNIKGALLDLENTIVDGITSNDPALQKALSLAKNRYKNLIVLEPIANKAKGGFISPSLLNNRVSQVYKRAHTIGESGDIGNLARIGHELLPELGGSDTTQKMAYIGALTSGAVNPASIPYIATGIGAGRAFQSGINRNQRMMDKAIQKQLRALPPAEAMKLLDKR